MASLKPPESALSPTKGIGTIAPATESVVGKNSFEVLASLENASANEQYVEPDLLSTKYFKENIPFYNGVEEGLIKCLNIVQRLKESAAEVAGDDVPPMVNYQGMKLASLKKSPDYEDAALILELCDSLLLNDHSKDVILHVERLDRMFFIRANVYLLECYRRLRLTRASDHVWMNQLKIFQAEKDYSFKELSFYDELISQSNGLLETLKQIQLSKKPMQQPSVAAQVQPPSKKLTFAERIALNKTCVWGDMSSDEDVAGDLSDLISHVGVESSFTGITIPADLEAVWPRAYTVIEAAAKLLKLDINKHQTRTMASAGFKYASSFHGDGQKAAFAELKAQEQAAINTVKAAFIFIRLAPDAVLCSDSKFGVAATYVLSHLVKGDDEETTSNIRKCLKNGDGGASTVQERFESMFSTDKTVGRDLFNAVDKIHRLHMKNLMQNDMISAETNALVVKFCFTTPEGMVNAYCENEKRKVKESFTVVDPKNPKKTIVETREKIVNGKKVPSLNLGSDFLTVAEKQMLKPYENRFCLTKMAKLKVEKFISDRGKIENAGSVVKKIVSSAFSATREISSAIRTRRELLRAKLASSGVKVTPALWQATQMEVMAGCTNMTNKVCTDLEKFCAENGT